LFALGALLLGGAVPAADVAAAAGAGSGHTCDVGGRLVGSAQTSATSGGLEGCEYDPPHPARLDEWCSATAAQAAQVMVVWVGIDSPVCSWRPADPSGRAASWIGAGVAGSELAVTVGGVYSPATGVAELVPAPSGPVSVRAGGRTFSAALDARGQAAVKLPASLVKLGAKVEVAFGGDGYLAPLTESVALGCFDGGRAVKGGKRADGTFLEGCAYDFPPPREVSDWCPAGAVLGAREVVTWLADGGRACVARTAQAAKRAKPVARARVAGRTLTVDIGAVRAPAPAGKGLVKVKVGARTYTPVLDGAGRAKVKLPAALAKKIGKKGAKVKIAFKGDGWLKPLTKAVGVK
jgi:hypothetical protein